MKPLTRRQILGYTVGDLGINLNFQLIGFYLAYFYTDVFGLSPVHVAGLFLVARIWDTVEYGHWKTGVRSECMPYAFFSLMQKMGLAVGGAFAALMLSWTGYVANAEQTPLALGGIEATFNLIPAAFSVLCLLTLFLYKINGPFFERINRDLEDRAVADSAPRS